MGDRPSCRSKNGRFTKAWRAGKTVKATEAWKKRCHREPPDDGESAQSGRKRNAHSSSPGPVPPTKKFCLEDRRVVHLRTLTFGLSKCQKPSCEGQLRLEDCEEEQRFGLGSIRHVRCKACSFVSLVDTDLRAPRTENARGPRPFEGTQKAAIGKSNDVCVCAYAYQPL